MREIAETHAWKMLERESSDTITLPRTVVLNERNNLVLDMRCQVVAGFNGAGKTETLGSIASSIGPQCCIIRLHEITERVRSVLMSRSDIEDMEDEVGPLAVDSDLTESISRVVGREYDRIEWFSLELETTEIAGDVDWPWTNNGPNIVPHFRVAHAGSSYRSSQMGLGEFSAHILFWILWQYRTEKGTVFLLDEPDAYLPPRTRMRFLALALDMARKYDWQLVITTHSEEMIATAHERGALTIVLREEGLVRASRSSDHGGELVRDLVPKSSVDLILFCEDESAAALTRALLKAYARNRGETTAVIWKDGDGYLRRLSEHLPRAPLSPVKFCLVFDGDQRGRVNDQPAGDGRRWPTLLLPTSEAPDALFKSLRSQQSEIAERLRQSETVVGMAMAALEGSDEHDWVNGMCDRLPPRTVVLDTLASLWVENNPAKARNFCDLLEASFK